MPLDINGYNDTFRKFAKFAQDEYDAGRHKSIAAAGVKVLKNRNIFAVSTAENDESTSGCAGAPSSASTTAPATSSASP